MHTVNNVVSQNLEYWSKCWCANLPMWWAHGIPSVHLKRCWDSSQFYSNVWFSFQVESKLMLVLAPLLQHLMSPLGLLEWPLGWNLRHPLMLKQSLRWPLELPLCWPLGWPLRWWPQGWPLQQTLKWPLWWPPGQAVGNPSRLPGCLQAASSAPVQQLQLRTILQTELSGGSCVVCMFYQSAFDTHLFQGGLSQDLLRHKDSQTDHSDCTRVAEICISWHTVRRLIAPWRCNPGNSSFIVLILGILHSSWVL